MFNLSFSTLSCDYWNVDKMIECCKKTGIRAIEIREDQEGLAKDLLKPDQKEFICSRLMEAGITVTNMGSSICVTGYSKEKLEDMKRSFELARPLNAKGVRFFLGNFIKRWDEPKNPLDYEGMVRWIKDACDMGKDYGVSPWLESHNEYSTGRVIRKLIDDVERDNFGVIWDILHPIEEGEDPEDTIKLLGKQFVHVHIKDARKFPDPIFHDWEYTRLGEGSLSIKEIVKLIKSSGYNGYYSMEWELKWRKELQVPGNEVEPVLMDYFNYMNSIDA